MNLFSENESPESTKELDVCKIKGIRKQKVLFNFIPYCTFKHGDKTTNLIKARILEDYEKGHMTAPDSAKYVCFEIPTDINLYDLAEDNVFSILEQVGELSNLEDKRYNHIGIIDKTSDGEYKLYNPTSEVLEFVQSNMDKEIEESSKMFSQRVNRKNFVQRISKPAKEYINEKERQRQQRKENPFFEEQFRYKIGNKVYQDYKGTSLKDGKILKLSRVDMIYDEPGNILYSGFIQTSDREEDISSVILQKIPSGFPILFVLQDKMENMIEKGNSENILQLLSSISEDILNINEMQYIGGLDIRGNIDIDIARYSKEIGKQIKIQKENFKKLKEDNLERV